MKMNEHQQQLAIQLSVFEQQMRQIQQQLQIIEQGIIELNDLFCGLEELKGKKDSEILAPVGRGVFAKTKLISEDLLVDVGEKTFVKKNIPETKKLIEEQIVKLKEVQGELDKELNNLNNQVSEIILKEQEKKRKG